MKRFIAILLISAFFAATATSCASYGAGGGMTHSKCIGQKPNNQLTGRHR